MDTNRKYCKRFCKKVAYLKKKKKKNRESHRQIPIDRVEKESPFIHNLSPVHVTGVISGGVRHRLSVGSASGLSCGGEKYIRGGRTGDGRAGGGGREKEDDTKSADNVSRGVLPSRQSLLDLVSGKFMGRHTPTHHYYHQQQQQVGYTARDLTRIKYSFRYHTLAGRRYPGEDTLRARARAHRALDIGPRISSPANPIFLANNFAIPSRLRELEDLTEKDGARGRNEIYFFYYVTSPLPLISTFSVAKNTELKFFNMFLNSHYTYCLFLE